MVMNNNRLEFNKTIIEVPKIRDEQYLLLRYILMTIEKTQTDDNSYFINTNLFSSFSTEELYILLKRNIEITVIDKEDGTWMNFHVINDIILKKDKIFFRPANIVRANILNKNTKSSITFLNYILFNGIKHKQTLLLLDYIVKLTEYTFELTIIDFKKLLELKVDQYKNFHQLEEHIIKRALKEINEKTAITLNYEVTRKERKKVVGLTFSYFKKDLEQ